MPDKELSVFFQKKSYHRNLQYLLLVDSVFLNQRFAISFYTGIHHEKSRLSGKENTVQLFQILNHLDKFRYNIELKNQLLATNDAVIALCNKYDLVNGIGLNVDDSRIYKTKNWLGSNLHGFSLMEVRSTLKKEG